MLLNIPPPPPSDAFTLAYHSTALVRVYACTVVWECMCACVSPPPPPPLVFCFLVFLSFDGSETLIKINIIGFTLHPTNRFPPPPPPHYTGFPIHPQRCLELEAFFLFQDRIQKRFFLLLMNPYSKAQHAVFLLPPAPPIKLGKKGGGGGGKAGADPFATKLNLLARHQRPERLVKRLNWWSVSKS